MHRGVVVIALVAGLAAPAQAVEIELKNDGFADGGTVLFQGGFAAGEIGASRLTPPAGGPYPVKKIRFMFGGAADVVNVRLHIWVDTGLTDPGTEIFTKEYTVLGADDAIQEIDVSTEGVNVTGPFRVGIEVMHSDYPGLGRDNDGTAAGRNFIFGCFFPPCPNTWNDASIVVPGDWIIRAVIDDGGSPGSPDAAPPGTPDASPPGTPDSGPEGGDCVSNGDCAVGQYCNEFGACSFDCREDGDCGDEMSCNSLGICVAAEGDGGGCGCRLASQRTSHWPLITLLPLALAWLRRHRRRVV